MPLPAIFKPVTLAENRVVEYIIAGRYPVPCWDRTFTFDQRIVRSSFLRALCCGRIESPEGTGRIKNVLSLHLFQALIVSKFDLAECSDLPHITLRNCVITEGISLKNAECGGIHLIRCFLLCHGIDARGMQCRGAVQCNRVRASTRAELNFSQADIASGCSLSELFTPATSAATRSFRKHLDQLVARLEAKSNVDRAAGDAADTAIVLPAVPVDADYTAAINPGKLVTDIWARAAAIAPPAQDRPSGFSLLSLRSAHICGDLRIDGLSVFPRVEKFQTEGDANSTTAPANETAVDAEHAEIKGDVYISRSKRHECILSGKVDFSHAEIAGQLEIAGTQIIATAQNEDALNVEGAQIGSHFVLLPRHGTRTSLTGGIRAIGAHIKGQFQLRGVVVHAETSILGDGAAIENDVFIQPEEHDSVEIHGLIQFPGATIGGQLNISGATIESHHKSGLAISMRDIEVKGGIFIRSADRVPSQVQGEIHMNDAVVGGVFDVIGSTLEAGSSGFAISADGATIESDVRFKMSILEETSSAPEGYLPCQIKGCVRMPGATINGRFRILGAEIGLRGLVPKSHTPSDADSLPSDNHDDARNDSAEKSALIISGATIRGGFFADAVWSAKKKESTPCVLRGALRVNHAQIDSRLQLRGVNLQAWDCGSRVALSAIGLHLRGDLELQPAKGGNVCIVCGEIRLIGATITGALEIVGGKIAGHEEGTGFAIDGYSSAIERGVLLRPVTQRDIQTYLEDQGSRAEVITLILKDPKAKYDFTEDEKKAITHIATNYSLSIEGIVGFAYARLASLTIGVSPKEPQWVPNAVQLDGVLRLDGITIKDATFIKQVRFTSPGCFPRAKVKLADRVSETLDRLSDTNRRTIISAHNATLGNVFSVKLSEGSCGAIELFGTQVVTLDDWDFRENSDNVVHGAPHQTEVKLCLGWGKPPSGDGWFDTASSPRYDGVRLGLDGFTYRRFADPAGTVLRPRGRLKWLRRSASAGPDWLASRQAWLWQQYPKCEMSEDSFCPLPYIQLAGVFRAHGFNREADEVSIDRRNYLVRYGTLNPLDWTLQWLYGFFFGFAYRSESALATCLILLLVNVIFALVGNGAIPLRVLPSTGHAQLWLMEAQHPRTAPSVLDLKFFFHPGPVKAATHDSADSPSFPSPQLASLPAAGTCRCSKHKRKARTSKPPPVHVMQQGEASGPLKPPAAAAPCACQNKNAVLYAIDQTLPLIHVTHGNGCELTGDAPKLYYGWRILMLFLGWIVIPTATLTFSGILRETNK
jgi:hypothetical protein